MGRKFAHRFISINSHFRTTHRQHHGGTREEKGAQETGAEESGGEGEQYRIFGDPLRTRPKLLLCVYK